MSEQTYGYMMAGASVLQAFTSLGNMFAQREYYRGQQSINNATYNINKELLEMKADDAIERGEQTLKRYRKSVKQIIGRQRANLAAQGIDLESGSALQIQEDTQMIAAMDELTIRNNAWKESWGYKMDSINLAGQHSFNNSSLDLAQRQGFLLGGMQMTSNLMQGGAYATRYSASGKVNSTTGPQNLDPYKSTPSVPNGLLTNDDSGFYG